MSCGTASTRNGLRDYNLIIVLDSNEYINFLIQKSSLLNIILENEKITILIDEIVIKEVLRHVNETVKKDFYKLLFKYSIIVNKEKLPFHLFEKYKNMGLKKGDIKIAAFCEYAEAEYLISENRHFLKEFKIDKFKVVSLNEFLIAQGK